MLICWNAEEVHGQRKAGSHVLVTFLYNAEKWRNKVLKKVMSYLHRNINWVIFYWIARFVSPVKSLFIFCLRLTLLKRVKEVSSSHAFSHQQESMNIYKKTGRFARAINDFISTQPITSCLRNHHVLCIYCTYISKHVQLAIVHETKDTPTFRPDDDRPSSGCTTTATHTTDWPESVTLWTAILIIHSPLCINLHLEWNNVVLLKQWFVPATGVTWHGCDSTLHPFTTHLFYFLITF